MLKKNPFRDRAMIARVKQSTLLSRRASYRASQFLILIILLSSNTFCNKADGFNNGYHAVARTCIVNFRGYAMRMHANVGIEE